MRIKQQFLPHQLCTLVHKQQVRQLIGQYLADQPAWLLDAICLLKEGAITQAYVQHDGVKAAELFYQLLMQLDKQPSA
ncbi:hypothetical protein SAMN04488136_12211 [Vibrio xiamenensis]|uniref:Uncharacterized protein n=1 Tax=Vibrio xiamenensis TaxID=861298 RepID=A0A1G8DX19_9VIBR|nr:hypothetical protein [Vibrio xiamenensis]SDH62237.1 hypothetical protein SAMN04488136_12211 [Vibrio xiamenensis]